MADELKPHAPKPYVPKRPGQTYQVDADGSEKILTPKEAEKVAAVAESSTEKSGRSGKSS